MSKEKEDSAENKKEEVVKSLAGRYFSKIRENIWVLSTFVLGVLLALTLILRVTDGTVRQAASEKVVSDKVMNFLNSQNLGGGVTLSSISDKGSYYELIINYQGRQVPLQATLDGNYIFTELVPTTGGVGRGAAQGTKVGSGGRLDIDYSKFKGNSSLGDANAPVIIIDFSDYKCPFCKRHHDETMPLIKSKYIDTGKVRVIFADFISVGDVKNHEAARCVRELGEDDAFWKMHDKLYENQQILNNNILKDLAVESGVDGKAFQECLSSGRHSQAVKADTLYGQSLGITGTPGFFINGTPVSGAKPYSVFQQIIEQELAAAGFKDR